jgi:hypothetical protein
LTSNFSCPKFLFSKAPFWAIFWQFFGALFTKRPVTLPASACLMSTYAFSQFSRWAQRRFFTPQMNRFKDLHQKKAGAGYPGAGIGTCRFGMADWFVVRCKLVLSNGKTIFCRISLNRRTLWISTKNKVVVIISKDCLPTKNTTVNNVFRCLHTYAYIGMYKCTLVGTYPHKYIFGTAIFFRNCHWIISDTDLPWKYVRIGMMSVMATCCVYMRTKGLFTRTMKNLSRDKERHRLEKKRQKFHRSCKQAFKW